MANATVIAATGIVVSGVVGPGFSAWCGRRASRQQFKRDQGVGRRDDLRAVLDSAAELLGLGATNMRIAREAIAARRDEPESVRDWASRVHLMRQRLLLRIPADDPVIARYETVVETILAIQEADANTIDPTVAAFEHAQSEFLSAARVRLEATIKYEA